MKRSGALLVAWVALCPLAARAQSAIGVSSTAEADGLKVGDVGRLHIYGNVDLRYDSNPVFLPQNPVADLALRARIGMALQRPSERLEFAFYAHADWTQWFGIINRRTRELSTFQALADFRMLANREGKVTFFLDENFSRNDVPANAAINQRLRNIRSLTTLASDIRPTSRALEFRLGYSLDFALYDRDQISVLNPDSLTYMTHTPSVRGLWRFFPKTAIVLEAQGAFTHYPLQNAQVTTPAINGIRVLAGLQGAITDKLNVVVKAGYGNTFSSAGSSLSNFSSVIAHVSAIWRPTDTTTLSLGYSRDFVAVPLFGWFGYDKPWLEAQQLLLGRLIASFKAQYMYERFGPPVLAGIDQRRIDHVILGEVRVGYQIQPWLRGSVYYQPDLRFSTFQSPSGVAGSYTRHVIGLDIAGGY